MRTLGSGLEFAASDLARHGACRHLTVLDLSVATGLRAAPSYHDPTVDILAQRGLEHERRYVDGLRGKGFTVVDLSDLSGGAPTETALDATLDALRSGADVVVQPTLRHEKWFGRPDVLRRVDALASALGAWSYEVVDTKLAEETRGATVLQLAVYSDLLSHLQGVLPECFYVVTPDPTAPVQTYRVQDYAAYFRLLRKRLETATRETPATLMGSTYPEPVDYCDVCRWWSTCNTHRHDDDHLSLVAGISRLQMRELKDRGIKTLAQVGSLPMPLPFSPKRGSTEAYERVREQARVQLLGRTHGKPVYEVLEGFGEEHGLARLPAPSPGDIFLDLEGDPFARDGGREYLFGLAVLGANGRCTYHRYWAHSDTEESAAFDAVVRMILDGWDANPSMHVYHYASYEPAAMKRLMGRYAANEATLDRMLRADLFVDLYDVARHAIRGSVERYSIKDLEVFYSFKRELDLRDAGTSRRVVERALELGAVNAITDEVRAAVEAYNRDDCLSARALRDWLESLRVKVEKGGVSLPRRRQRDGSAPETVTDRTRRIEPIIKTLTADVPLERSQRSDEQQARWLLANLLDWHRRENRAVWWEFFRLRDLPERGLLDEPAILTGLAFIKRVDVTKRGIPTDRYSFPQQDFELRGRELHLRDERATTFGDIVSFDAQQRTIEVRKRGAHAEVHPSTAFLHSTVPTDDLEDAIERIAEDVVRHGIDGGAQYRVARELLLRRAPTLRGLAFTRIDGEPPIDFARRIVPHLDATVLPIQGPPGAGKTRTGARMICDLVRKGMRVGITAVSHKVIRHLLEGVVEAAREERLAVSCVEKVAEKSDAPTAIEEFTKNGDILARLQDGRANVAGGTQWLWAGANAADAVDVLFVDEAGQLSLANVVAVSHAAKSLVLLGDPQQLEQPQQGSHPEGTGVSVLEHVLGDHQTMPSDRGIFLAETWRLAPPICSFTSEVFYEGRLEPEDGCVQQRLSGTAPFEGSGLWMVPAEHEGNRNSSVEEVEVVAEIVSSILRSGACWVDREGKTKPMTPANVLVVAPYNAQVTLLTERLGPRGVRVGTVDKFQGQEAPVLIYSMATSAPEEAPRGMEFLYNLNRLNVATSRARCACILVASPRLFDPECRTPRQMKLANALCRYLERATLVSAARSYA
jgi:predicted RecB family nuclease